MIGKLNRVNLMTDLVMPLAIMIFIYPNAVTQYPAIVSCITFLWDVLFYICVLYFVRFGEYKNIYIISWLIFFAWIIIVSGIVSKTIPSMQTYRNYFCILLTAGYCMKKCPKKFISWVATVMTVWIMFNTLLWKAGGMYINANGQAAFFLGTKTSLTCYQITGCCFIWLLYCIASKKEKKYALFLWSVMVVSVIVWNIREPISTSIVCLSIFALFVLLMNSKLYFADVILKMGFPITLFLNVGIVFFGFQNLFASLITNTLNESMTLNNRTLIWKVVISKIVDSPVIGHGTETNTIFSIDNGISLINKSPHNFLLYLIFVTGTIGTVYFLFLCFWTLKRAGTSNIYGRIIHITFIAFGFMWITEQLKTYDMFIFCMIAGMYSLELDTRKIGKKRITLKL